MSTALVPQQSNQIQQWKSPAQIKQRIEAIQQLMSTVLKKDTDYGIIPGMPKGTKPSLWKPGSEQILAMFQIAVDPVVEDLSVEDCYRYRVTTRLTNVLTGEFLGAGIGEASTDETKYKWKKCWAKAEFEATDPDRRRIKYSTYDNVTKEEMQVRQEPADLANTILKMAKKRSQIDATLTVTGASSMFEQDLEDLPEETRQEMARQKRGKKDAPAPVGDVMCAECRVIGSHHKLCKYYKEPNAAAAPAPTEPVATSLPPTASEPPQQAENRLAVKITKVIKRTKKPLRTIEVLTDAGQVEMSVWHEHFNPILDNLQKVIDDGGKQFGLALIEYSEKEKDGRIWSSLEKIIELDGVPLEGK